MLWMPSYYLKHKHQRIAEQILIKATNTTILCKGKWRITGRKRIKRIPVQCTHTEQQTCTVGALLESMLLNHTTLHKYLNSSQKWIFERSLRINCLNITIISLIRCEFIIFINYSIVMEFLLHYRNMDHARLATFAKNSVRKYLPVLTLS